MITPLKELGGQVPIQGRIRLGTKSAKGFPTSLSTFRFTSQDKFAIEAIADVYGGEVAQWRKEWEVITKADEIPVLLPPNPLGGTPQYELWGGGGRLRICDGEMAEVPVATNDSAEIVEQPCICDLKQAMECKVSTRLSLILRAIPFGGAWMLTSTGWYAAKELPGMVAMVQMAEARGLVKARLRLEKREKKEQGKPMKKFVVPVLSPDVTLEELSEGKGQLGSYNSPKELGS